MIWDQQGKLSVHKKILFPLLHKSALSRFGLPPDSSAYCAAGPCRRKTCRLWMSPWTLLAHSSSLAVLRRCAELWSFGHQSPTLPAGNIKPSFTLQTVLFGLHTALFSFPFKFFTPWFCCLISVTLVRMSAFPNSLSPLLLSLSRRDIWSELVGVIVSGLHEQF